MTSAELREWQQRMGLTAPAAARTLGLPLGTYRHYRYGTRRIPEMVDALIELIGEVEKFAK